MIALLALLFFPVASGAAAPHFTTVFFDDEGVVYAGLKNTVGDALVISFPFHSGDRTVIPLPADTSRGDVIGLLTEKAKLFVLTSVSDHLHFHVYDRDKSSWTPLGKVLCPSFTKARLSSKRITFSCEVGKTKRGKTRVSQKSISYGKERLYRKGIWRFPEYLLRHKGRVAVLEGYGPLWESLRMRTANDERTITASDLLRIPLPPKVDAPASP